jgi:TonB family protein
MIRNLIISAILLLCCPAFAKKEQMIPSMPGQFLIGRHTFMDLGPPHDFYEIFIVRAIDSGTSVEKLTVTPTGLECRQPPQVEVASARLNEPLQFLLGTNPCTIPEKELHRELKRCKNCLVFSGANVTMQVQCGNRLRNIRADILDRDMFDPSPNTPPNTSWTMRLLERLDQSTGPGVWDKPMFALPKESEVRIPDSESIRNLREGKYDSLFVNAPEKPSEIYRASQDIVKIPSKVLMLSSQPIPPNSFVMPDYPIIAGLAHVEGVVSLQLQVGNDGEPINLTIEKGHPLLNEAVKKAASSWKYPKDKAGIQIRVDIQFTYGCPGGRTQAP